MKRERDRGAKSGREEIRKGGGRGGGRREVAKLKINWKRDDMRAGASGTEFLPLSLCRVLFWATEKRPLIRYRGSRGGFRWWLIGDGRRQRQPIEKEKRGPRMGRGRHLCQTWRQSDTNQIRIYGCEFNNLRRTLEHKGRGGWGKENYKGRSLRRLRDELTGAGIYSD